MSEPTRMTTKQLEVYFAAIREVADNLLVLTRRVDELRKDFDVFVTEQENRKIQAQNLLKGE